MFHLYGAGIWPLKIPHPSGSNTSAFVCARAASEIARSQHRRLTGINPREYTSIADLKRVPRPCPITRRVTTARRTRVLLISHACLRCPIGRTTKLALSALQHHFPCFFQQRPNVSLRVRRSVSASAAR
jgi:hypothetical protein